MLVTRRVEQRLSAEAYLSNMVAKAPNYPAHSQQETHSHSWWQWNQPVRLVHLCRHWNLWCTGAGEADSVLSIVQSKWTLWKATKQLKHIRSWILAVRPHSVLKNWGRTWRWQEERPTSSLVLWVRKDQLVHMLSWDWKSVAWMRMISWSFLEFTHKRKYRSNRKIFCSNQMLIDGHIWRKFVLNKC